MKKPLLYLVTGGTSGIGLATTKLLLSEGHRVIAVARSKRESIVNLSEEYSNFFYFEARDLAKEIDEIPSWLKSIAAKYGKISGVLCSAGISSVLPNRFNSNEQMLKTFNINLFSVLSMTKGLAVKNVMAEKDRSIVFIASVAASIGTTGLANYGASKAALIGAMKSLAKEYAPSQLRVNTISPGLIKTELTSELYQNDLFDKLDAIYPLGLGDCKFIAEAASFLLSNKSKWITGIDLVVDGGISLGINE